MFWGAIVFKMQILKSSSCIDYNYLSVKLLITGARPGIRKGGGQNLKAFFFFGGGGPAQKIDEKMIFSTKKVAKYRWNSLKFAL